MDEQPYRRLAQRLDQLPNGFPPTKSGVELKLLQKLFEAQEAALAAHLRLEREPAAAIAARAGKDASHTYSLLKKMARKGLIRYQRQEGEIHFGLMPFVVGFYEEQLPNMDQELASLFERYFQETKGFQMDGLSVHRVIPVEEAIPFELEVHPYEQASELLEGAKSWGVRDCICRVQQRLIGQDCGHPVENCLVFAPMEGAFDNSEVDRAISKEQALRILRDAERAGLVHTTGNYIGPHYYICNCCTCSCGILRSVAEFGLPNAVAKSHFVAAVDPQECLGCEDCLPACQFGALAVEDEVCQVDVMKCVGCGLCAAACAAEALGLSRRPAPEAEDIPATIQDWGRRRAQERGLSLDA